jgi:hypothetical membrane protein
MLPVDRRQSRSELQDHIFGTYVSLRYGLAAIGGLLPVTLYLVGKSYGIELRPSMSGYYWADVPGVSGGSAPARDVFVGGLFAVAACLYLYKGFTRAENLLLNTAAILAVGVAVFPEGREGSCGWLTLHGFVAMGMFLCLALVVWTCSGDTLGLLPDDSAARYRGVYKVIGLTMLGSPVTAFVVNALMGSKAFTFWIECAGIWAFAAYWFTKSRELQQSNTTKRALRGELETSPQGKALPAAAADTPPEGQRKG